MAPRPFSTCERTRLSAIERLYFDVDDTITTAGALLPDVVEALYEAKTSGLSLVAVTGRSAAWGEMLLRLFPLDAVIAETGAICFYRRARGGVGTVHSEPDQTVRRANARRRQTIVDAALSRVPRARLALDNMGRLYDTAFDLVEDGPQVDELSANDIRGVLERGGLRTVQSSVHINAWFGDFDKAKMVNRYLMDIEGGALRDVAKTLLYIGDSVNDAGMFAAAGVSVGVANVARVLSTLEEMNSAPEFVTLSEMGAGFCEVVQKLVLLRGD